MTKNKRDEDAGHKGNRDERSKSDSEVGRLNYDIGRGWPGSRKSIDSPIVIKDTLPPPPPDEDEEK